MSAVLEAGRVRITIDVATALAKEAWGSLSASPFKNDADRLAQVAQVAVDAYYEELEKIEDDEQMIEEIELMKSLKRSAETFQKKWDKLCGYEKGVIHRQLDMDDASFENFDLVMYEFIDAVEQTLKNRKKAKVPRGGKTRALKALVHSLKQQLKQSRGMKFSRGFDQSEIYWDLRKGKNPASQLVLSIATRLDTSWNAATCETAMRDQSVLSRPRKMAY